MNFEQATAYLSGMFTHNNSPRTLHMPYALAALYTAPVIFQHLVPKALLARLTVNAEPYLYGLMVALMYVEVGPDAAFIYFQF
jgi:alginate O-acetyltransferase complex protein AlgI